MKRLQLPKLSSQDFAFLGEWIDVMKPITQAVDKIRIILWNHTVIPFCQLFASYSVTPTHTANLVSALQTGLQKRLVAF